MLPCPPRQLFGVGRRKTSALVPVKQAHSSMTVHTHHDHQNPLQWQWGSGIISTQAAAAQSLLCSLLKAASLKGSE